MAFAPKPLGSRVLDPAVLTEDRRTCQRVERCGIGQKALYLNSFFFARRTYVCYEEIRRTFKRVAMTKGGFSRKGPFASMPYLVVELAGGQEKQCNFKREEKVDLLIEEVTKRHPKIRAHSARSEKKLAEAAAARRADYVKDLPTAQENLCRRLEAAREHLERRPSLYRSLTGTATEKRARENMRPGLLAAAWAILLAAVVCGSIGIFALTQRHRMGIYFLIFGVAFAALVLASRILPVGRGSRGAVIRRWETAVQNMEQHTRAYESFPLPARYAHPVVLVRMIRAIRRGKAKTADEALEVVKTELKALNASVRVTQEEYDEVVAIKPMFLICNYK